MAEAKRHQTNVYIGKTIKGGAMIKINTHKQHSKNMVLKVTITGYGAHLK